MNTWEKSLKDSTKTCIVQNERRKVHFTFEDGNEMVEEYHLTTHELLVRKHKSKTMTGEITKWQYEIGQDYCPNIIKCDGIMESLSNPICTRQDSKEYFEWRIRNLAFPLEVYDLQIDSNENLIIVRTSNKKFYKKIPIPDMNRMKLVLAQSSLKYSHANNTLIIKYAKPDELLNLENCIKNELKKLKKGGDGDIEMCTTS